MKPTHHRIIPNWLLLICAIVIVGALGYLVWFYCCTQPVTTPTPIAPTNTNTNSNSNTNSTTTAGWKTYANSTYGFSLKYPTSVSITESTRSMLDNMGTNCQLINLDTKTTIKVCDKTNNLTQYGLREPNGMDPTKTSSLTIGNQPAKKYTSSGVSYVVLSPNDNRIEITTTDITSQNINTLEQILSTFQFTK